MAINVGVAAGSWGVSQARAPGQIEWHVFLDESAQASYEWIEAGPYGYLPTDVDLLRAELDTRGLKVTATTVMNGHLEEPEDWPTIEEEVLKAGELGASLGTKHLVLIDDFYTVRATGQRVMDRELGDDGWKRLIEGTYRVADLAGERFGLPIAFHPHTETHVETENQLEAFLEDTDPERVSLCFDTGHHAFCGGDPVEFMRRQHERVSYMHFKDLDRQVLERVRRENIPLQAATEIGVFCEIGLGVIDYAELGKVLHETGFDGWVIVEEDISNPPPHLPLPRARRAREYLHGVGIG